MPRQRPSTVIDAERALRPEFVPYLAQMDFLAEVLGPGTEIVLHDTSDLSRSIVALTNGHISGRTIGGPATDLVLKVLQNQEQDDREYLTNYLAQSRAGRRFRSSTLFVKDASGRVVGMLCVNIDDEPLAQARELLAAITETHEVGKDEAVAVSAAEVAERFSSSVDELTLDSVTRIVTAQAVDAVRMTPDEKIATVRELERAGVFLLKGAVAHTSEALHVSEPTVYRYLKQVRR